MRIFFIALIISTLFFGTSGINTARADKMDVLVNKLVEKGILTASEARELLEDLQKEESREKSEVKEVASETAKAVAKKEIGAGAIDVPKWVKKIKLHGDLRLRHDTQWREEKNGSVDYHRNRERYRLRVGAKANVTDNTEVGVKLASGSGYQNTTNQSATGHARGKGIYIDQAYATWKASKNITLMGGKFKNPLRLSPLVWDSDVNPEGLAECVHFNASDQIKLYANFGQYFVEELNIKDTDSDPTLMAYQVGAAFKPAKNTTLNVTASYYDFINFDEIDYDADDIGDKETWQGYNHKHGQQMIFDNDGKLLNEFGCWELGVSLKMKEVLPVPLSIFGNYIVNADADIDELMNKGVDNGETDPADLAAYGGDDRDTGWQVGLSLGNKKKQGDWYFKYFYQVLEDYAFPAVFVDSDFHGGGTNNKGHYASGLYCLTDNIQGKMTWFFTERDDESKDGQKDEDRVQIDLIFKF